MSNILDWIFSFFWKVILKDHCLQKIEIEVHTAKQLDWIVIDLFCHYIYDNRISQYKFNYVLSNLCPFDFKSLLDFWSFWIVSGRISSYLFWIILDFWSQIGLNSD